MTKPTPQRKSHVANMGPGEGAIDVSAAREGSLAGLLLDGEEIVFAVRPSRWMIVRSLPGMFLVFPLLLVWFYFMEKGDGRSLVFLLQKTAIWHGLFLVTALPARVWFWRAVWYVVTNRRVLKIGAFRGGGLFEYPLLQLREVTVAKQTRWARRANFGDIEMTLEGNPDAFVWNYVRDPHARAEQIRQAVIRYGGKLDD